MAADFRSELIDLRFIEFEKEFAVEYAFDGQAKMDLLAGLGGRLRSVQNLHLPWKPRRAGQGFRKGVGEAAGKFPRCLLVVLITHGYYSLPQFAG